MSKSIRKLATLLCIALMSGSLVAIGCGDDDEGGDGGGGGGGGGGLDGASLKVGSKEFTEQLVLGQITVLALENAGADVKDETGLAGSVAARQALEAGEIDMYWEYTGTNWLTYLKKTKPIPDAQKQYDAVKISEKANDIELLDPAPANNTYAFAVRSEAAGELGVETISDFKELVSSNPDDATLCVGEEFTARDDGLPGVEKTYGFEFPEDGVIKIDEGIIYTEVDKGGKCNYGEVFITDGRIAANDLTVIEDDKAFFPVYNPALNMRADALKKYPALADVFNPIAAKLDSKTLQTLNAQVDVDGIPEEEVAKKWLEDNGFLK
ncbi:MAG: glycine betaine ABC transporter substrate-binding protein [Thermoleophilaceae bacterium]|nr:glycine betaine ABC transporter substrate-binding protein [Thermoleophilaceae bacterium]